jgi:hypothetical protein
VKGKKDWTKASDDLSGRKVGQTHAITLQQWEAMKSRMAMGPGKKIDAFLVLAEGAIALGPDDEILPIESSPEDHQKYVERMASKPRPMGPVGERGPAGMEGPPPGSLRITYTGSMPEHIGQADISCDFTVPVQIVKPYGSLALSAVTCFFSKDSVDLVFKPILADMHYEQAEAIAERASRKRLFFIWLRGYYRMVKALLPQTGWELVKNIVAFFIGRMSG